MLEAAVPFLCCTSPLHRKLRFVRKRVYPPVPKYLRNADRTDIDGRLLHFLALDVWLAKLRRVADAREEFVPYPPI